MASRTARADPAQLKLADLVAVAVRQSPELERARIDVATAQAQLLQAEGIEDAHVAASGSAKVIRPGDSDPFGEQEELNAALSVTKPLSTGGSFGLQLFAERTHSGGTSVDGGTVSFASKRDAANLALGITQPLLRGAGATAFEAPIRQAAQQRDAAALTREARARDLVVSLAQAYWQVAVAWRQLEVRKTSLKLAEQQLAYTEGAIRAEKISRSEALAVQEAIATRKQDVIAGEQDVYERSLALRQLGGLEIGPEAIAVTTEVLPETIAAPALDLPAVVSQAFAHSAELAAFAASRRAAEIAVAAADNAAKSKLDVSLSAGPAVAGGTVGEALSASSAGYEIDASLSFDHAIGGRAERGGQAIAQAALRTAKVAEREARAKLAVRATRAVQRAQAALASIALGSEAIGLAEQNVTAEQKRFELGKSTNFEVLRRQDELEQARLRHASAIADYLSARAELDGVSGTILARYNIVMP
ncbi:MAG: TolC family protein [Kofleriaceae bacterium]